MAAPEASVLTKDLIYEAADLPKSIPYDQIRFIGISLQSFTDLSLLTELTNLRIVTFRLCGFTEFPPELFKIPTLISIDLSGNAITTLPEPENFSPLVNVRQLNFSENNISNIQEIPKLVHLINLKHLILTGNICLSANDAFNQIVATFPKLIVLNDMIITSQHRGYIENSAQFDSQSCLPLSKIDDYFFLYVKYMHSSSAERFVRRSNAEFFCLSKVIRRYSAADKIQSVFRGYLKRRVFKKMKNSAIFIQLFIKFWYYKRMKAANLIQITFLHYKLRLKIKTIVNARKIQATWRRYKTRQECLISIFEKNEKICFFVSENHLNLLKRFAEDYKFHLPDKEEPSKYYVIRLGEPIPQKLPGSPLVYYVMDKSALIRPKNNRKNTQDSVWCGHDHSENNLVTRVSKDGVNYTAKCVYNTVPYRPYIVDKRAVKLPKYEQLICCTYDDPNEFGQIIRQLCANRPPGLRLFTEKNILSVSAYLMVQSSCRSFMVRSKIFRNMKKTALELRAARCIKSFIHASVFKRTIQHSLNVLNYFHSLPASTTYFITKTQLDQVLLCKIPIKYKCKFGYSADRLVLIEPGEMQLPMLFVPIGKIVFALNDIASLFKVGVSTVAALPSMIEGSITSKWLKRNRIVRLTFANPDEARTRIALYSYLTGDFKSFMADSDVLPLCAANSIRNGWIGFSTRRTITHIGAQVGKKLNLQCLIKHSTNHEKNTKKPIDNEYQGSTFIRKHEEDLNPEDAIARLRNDYRPWHKEVAQYKEWCRQHPDYLTKNQNMENNEPEPPSQSKLNLGMVNNIDQDENQDEQNNVTLNSPSRIQNSKKVTRRSIDTAITYKSVSPIKKPLVVNSRFPQKPFKFEMEMETQTIFNAPLTQIHQMRPSTVLQRSHNSGNNLPHRSSSIQNCPKPVLTNTLNNSSKMPSRLPTANFNDYLKEDEYPDAQKRASSTITSMKPYATPNPSKSSYAAKKLPKTANLQTRNIDEYHEPNYESRHILHHNSEINSNANSGSEASTEVYLQAGVELSLLNSEKNTQNNTQSISRNSVKNSSQLNSMSKTTGNTSKTSTNANSQIPSNNASMHSVKFDVNISKTNSVLNNNVCNEVNLNYDSVLDKSSQEMEPSKNTAIFETSKSLFNESLYEGKHNPNIESAQKTDRQLLEMMRAAFTKLVRLRQLGIEIEQAAVVDNTIEEKRKFAEDTRMQLFALKNEASIKQDIDLRNIRARNTIERNELLETHANKTDKATHMRNKKAQKMRSDHLAHVNKSINDKKFAQAFVSMSRNIAMQSEKAHMKAENARKFAGVVEKAEAAKSRAIESRNHYRQSIEEIKKAKKETAKWEKSLNDQRLSQMRTAHSLRIQKVAELTSENHALRDSIRTLKKISKNIVYSQPKQEVIVDQIEGAAIDITKYCGENLGLVESRLLVEMINEIIH
ncbi:hypothetical protein TRFO_32582 [Tritrichomonas foetus]|uniref:IQ calmodulin-binding motif family protein n=1 Tax=Tritrichomonas foetus TaxID=1144522 RepID=A0A1J4JNG3_9EUKA|nr:hypothetical protein TRFO_32582 [Tritrichomonas foetus]|eukprot:OHT00671.1 hypothetical protein TRFO_32582 [Tritrichomonas foetus]